jgi:hypothetical protein
MIALRKRTMPFTLFLIMSQLLVAAAGCGGRHEIYGFGLEFPPGVDRAVSVRFSDGNGWPPVDNGGTIEMIPGPVPDWAEISWTDAAGHQHKQHIQLAPLPPPTATSYNGSERMVYFVIQKDNTVKFVNHEPEFTQ